MVVKKDGKREIFERNKIMAGFDTRLEKTSDFRRSARSHRGRSRKTSAGLARREFSTNDIGNRV